MPRWAALAAPKDPLVALRAQLAAGKGFTIKQRTSGKATTTLTRSGRLQFDKRGIAASDLTAKLAVASDGKPVEDFGAPDGGGQAGALTKPERRSRPRSRRCCRAPRRAARPTRAA